MRAVRIVKNILWISLLLETAFVLLARWNGYHLGNPGIVLFRIMAVTFGTAIALEVVRAIRTGKILGKFGRRYEREQEAFEYWLYVAIYCVGAGAMLVMTCLPSWNLIPGRESIAAARLESPGNSANPPASSSKPAAPLTADQACDLIWRLPEARAWDAYIRKKTHNKVHGSMMVDGDPRNEDGRRCWWIRFGENGPEAWHPWQTFEVDVATGTVMVMDDIGEEKPLTLEQWRRLQHPLDRIK